MDTKYYFAANTSQRIAGVAFEPVEIFAGTQLGVFATSEPALIETLSKEKHVQEITKEDYDERLKKKVPSLGELRHSNKNLSSPVAVKEPAGVVVESPSKPATAPSAENILEPKPVTIPHTVPGKRRA